MKKFKNILVAGMLSTILVGCGNNNTSNPQTNSNNSSVLPGGDKIVEDIVIKVLPKTTYTLGEEFSIEGGIITLQYEDGTTGEVPFSNDLVTYVAPNMSSLGTKTVIIDYDGFQAQYQITINKQAFTINLDLNYQGADTINPLSVEVGGYATKPQNPTRQDYKFQGWTKDKEGLIPFDFETEQINDNITIYALWIEEISVKFDYGVKDAVTKVVSSGDVVSMNACPDLLVEGKEFLGWYVGEQLFDFSSKITTSVVLTAKWKDIDKSTAKTVTVSYNAGAEYESIQYYVGNGSTISAPSAPSIEGREFLGWYDAETGGAAIDFTKPITTNTTIYAHYKVDFYTVNFKYVANNEEITFRSREVKPEEKTTKLTVKPKEEGYIFDGVWYEDKDCTKVFDFNTSINKSYDLYTKALKENVFEAEYTNIDENKQGVGSSDTFVGLKLIFEDNGTAEASNGYWVSGLYNNGAFIEFVIYSSKAFTDGTLNMNLSAEWADIHIAPTNVTVGDQDFYAFEIATYDGVVDEQGKIKKDASGYAYYDESTKRVVDYNPIALEGAITFSESAYDKRPFTNHLISTSFALNEGYNVIRLTVRNSVSPFDGTMNANAPMIDNLVIYTNSTLTWEPKEENIADWRALNFAPNKHE